MGHGEMGRVHGRDLMLASVSGPSGKGIAIFSAAVATPGLPEGIFFLRISVKSTVECGAMFHDTSHTV
jgi:hypothetical protein